MKALISFFLFLSSTSIWAFDCPENFNLFEQIKLEQKKSAIREAITFDRERTKICGYQNPTYVLTLYKVLNEGFKSEKVELLCEQDPHNRLNFPEIKALGENALNILAHIKNKCDYDINIKNTKTATIGSGFMPDFIMERHLQSYFRKNKKPADLWLCSNALDDANVESLDNFRDPKPGCKSDHVLMLGVKKISNQCNYLIHTSKKKSFEDWKANWNCVCEYNGEYKSDCNQIKPAHRKSATVLACWIPGDHLARNLREISFLEKSE